MMRGQLLARDSPERHLAPVIDHRQIDLRSLALNRLVRAKVENDPALVEKARSNVERWLISCSPRVRATLLEWKELLNGPQETLLALLTSPDERATRLRQSSPFAGVLSTAERTNILQQFRTHEAASA